MLSSSILHCLLGVLVSLAGAPRPLLLPGCGEMSGNFNTSTKPYPSKTCCLGPSRADDVALLETTMALLK